MRRMSNTSFLTLMTCLAFAFAFGCESQPAKSSASADTTMQENDNSANSSGDKADSDTQDKSAMDQPKAGSSGGQMKDVSNQPEHAKPAAQNPVKRAGAMKQDSGTNDPAATQSHAMADENDLVDLSPLHIERHPSGVKPTNRLDATSDMIYATMRVQMDVLIDARKTLLDNGADVTDPEIRQKEASIRKAVDLLTQNGEYVEPIEPPIEGLNTGPAPTDSTEAANPKPSKMKGQ